MILISGSLLLFIILLNQLREKPLTGRLYRQPLALLLYIACALSFAPAVTPSDWLAMALALALSFSFGMLQGRFTPLIQHDGAWYLSGSIMAVLVWLLSVPVRAAFKKIAVSWFSLTPTVTHASDFIFYLLFIAGFLLGRYLMVFIRYPGLVVKTGQNEQRLRRQRSH
ncbi:hypothetical protein [Sporolactobacillus vineae]|uniref:hypothetical protein n=1 Tax=Sporolactobacillus vineae TaxID=444463 RepID=UPI000287EF06|nr:hypothetical protein [Sporolactobacillus vineae]